MTTCTLCKLVRPLEQLVGVAERGQEVVVCIPCASSSAEGRRALREVAFRMGIRELAARRRRDAQSFVKHSPLTTTNRSTR